MNTTKKETILNLNVEIKMPSKSKILPVFLFRMYSRKDIGMGGNQPMFDFAGEAEKAARSVFVGNIPYEATEEQLKSIFSEIGVVLSFRLVYDRETGKPKGKVDFKFSDFFNF